MSSSEGTEAPGSRVGADPRLLGEQRAACLPLWVLLVAGDEPAWPQGADGPRPPLVCEHGWRCCLINRDRKMPTDYIRNGVLYVTEK